MQYANKYALHITQAQQASIVSKLNRIRVVWESGKYPLTEYELEVVGSIAKQINDNCRITYRQARFVNDVYKKILKSTSLVLEKKSGELLAIQVKTPRI